MRVNTKVVGEWDSVHQRYVIVSAESFDYNGPVALMCGATGLQKQIGNGQKSFFDFMSDQAHSVFGEVSNVFKDLVGAFSPIVAAGPNQHGFNQEQRTDFNTQITQNTAQNVEKVSKAMNERMAGAGGGNVYVPTGAKDQLNQEMEASAANNESNQKLAVTERDYATGRENWLDASKGLAGAGNVFDPAINTANAATGAGKAASDTANQIAQADNSWVNATIGALGGIAGAAAGGL